ncbi:MAG: SurA N-terminal domain-containing protein [Kiritimatiellae bacterium]|nr:SurA N-terminal domain-containing protein [Kiritimatiellia bacterium]
MKKAFVNGVEISAEAVAFELERLARFYVSHGFSQEEVKRASGELRDKALEQAIGAKLLLDRAEQLDIEVSQKDVDEEVRKVVGQIGGEENYRRALESQRIGEEAFRAELAKGAKVNKLVEQACANAPEPCEDEIVAFYESRRSAYAAEGKTLVDAHDAIRDLLRHQARGRAMDKFVEELRAAAKIEYTEDR